MHCEVVSSVLWYSLNIELSLVQVDIFAVVLDCTALGPTVILRALPVLTKVLMQEGSVLIAMKPTTPNLL